MSIHPHFSIRGPLDPGTQRAAACSGSWREAMVTHMEPHRPVSLRDGLTARHFLGILGVRSADMDDLTQEVLIVLSCKTLAVVAPPGRTHEQAWRAFVFEVVTRITAHHRCKNAQRRVCERGAAEQPADVTAPSAEDLAIEHGPHALLEQVLEQLEREEPTFHAVISRHLDGATMEEIARALGLALGTAANRLRVGRDKVLREMRRRLVREEGQRRRRSLRRRS